MKNYLALTALILTRAFAADTNTETKIKMKDLPVAVQNAVAGQRGNATLKGLTREVEDGTTLYEAEFKVNGRGRDVSFDESGNLVSVEEEVALDSIPAAARDAIKSRAAEGKIKFVEKVTKGSVMYYEAQVKTGRADSEVKVNADGSPVQ
ncbi:MAG: hypothetical protein EXQ52_10800 [Bryobacterales bacterium]|nr:hypothetical protein [Bryobacterales bacterium]